MILVVALSFYEDSFVWEFSVLVPGAGQESLLLVLGIALGVIPAYFQPSTSRGNSL
jgi:hypothetical protein